jgi:hypothetical protein
MSFVLLIGILSLSALAIFVTLRSRSLEQKVAALRLRKQTQLTYRRYGPRGP